MHIKLKRLTGLLVVALALSVGTPAVVQAVEDSSPDQPVSNSRKDEAEARKLQGQQVAADKRDSAQARAAEVKAEKRQQYCERSKRGLETKFDRITRAAERNQQRIDEIFAKVQAYQQANNLQPAGYDELVAAAQSAKSAAADAVAILKNVPTELTCDGPGSAATQVKTFKSSAVQVRDSLKTYKQALKAVLQALREAKQPAAADGSN